jgi:O-succinylbenzoic acid--CoA ligase
MWHQFDGITINHIRYTRPEIRLLASIKKKGSNVPSWEAEFYQFLDEWFNESEYVAAKTSGSTGVPKDIVLSKNSMVASAQLTVRHLKLTAADHAFLCLSCRYIAGKMMVVRAIVSGMNLLVVQPSSFPLSDVLFEKIDFAAFVPMQLSAMLREDVYVNKIKSIGNIIVGGTEVSHVLREKINSFPNSIYETFGMTETISHIALKLLSQNSNMDYFETLDNITVSSDDHNCLIIYAPHIQQHPIATRDVVEIVDNKRFRWLGRIDNVVNSGGVKIYPEMLEHQLKPFIPFKFFMAGIPDDHLGQKLIAVVEADEQFDKKYFLDTMAKYLAPYEAPKQVICVRQFVYTPNGKINRKATLALL